MALAALSLVKVEHMAEIYSGQNVAVHDHQRVLRPFGQQGQGPGRAKSLLLPQILYLHAVAAAVAEVVLDHFPFVVKGDDEPPKAIFHEVFENDFQDGLGADLQKGLGRVLGQFAKARAQAAGHEQDGVWASD